MIIDFSKGFRVYRNLHKQCYSIQHYVKRKGWRLREHADEVCMFPLFASDMVKFKVYENGRNKVLSEKKKNVHAFVLMPHYTTDSDAIAQRRAENAPEEANRVGVRYNPYDTPAFTDEETGSYLYGFIGPLYFHMGKKYMTAGISKKSWLLS